MNSFTQHALSATFVFSALTCGATMAMAQDAKAGNAAEGVKKAAMCIGCHGIKGYQATFPEVYKVPMISGQSGKYIESALVAYQKGDRKHPTMRSIATSLTPQDMADLGAYYAAHNKAERAPDAAPVAPADVAGLLTKGACASCHGANYSKPIDASYPKLAGQHPDYLYTSLRGYKGEGGPYGARPHAIMGAQAKPYTAKELKAMADYLASLPSDLAVVPQSKFR
jgi:cytochrome c553